MFLAVQDFQVFKYYLQQQSESANAYLRGGPHAQTVVPS
ncbi:hypothetical protein RRG08_047048 [Elysia crispata]|uniref:Uncharacterized protein n=1 Tax=Elysia crispata TaxID=231223 RepID=A0AAE1E6M0_9GAST|nr:hypothetical protein RRG08_047048 [Elysia crispata]